MDIHAAVNLNDRTTDADSPPFVLIIVVGTPLVNIGKDMDHEIHIQFPCRLSGKKRDLTRVQAQQ